MFLVLHSSVGSWPCPQTLDEVERLAKYKCASLLLKFVNCGRKKFYKIGPRECLLKRKDQYSWLVSMRTFHIIAAIIDMLIDKKVKPGNTNLRGRLSTFDLLNRVAYFVKKKKLLTITKSSWSILVSTKRSTVQNLLPLQWGFPEAVFLAIYEWAVSDLYRSMHISL